MSFQIKDFISIVASMVNHMRGSTSKITDYNVGGVARTMVEAPAIEIDELYQQMVQGLTEAIPTAIYLSFDFTLIPAIPASGMATFSAPSAAVSPITIPAGTVVSSITAIQYQTAKAAVIQVGSTSVTTTVIAIVPGSSGNALPGAIVSINGSIFGVSTVTNALAITNGRGQETEDERRLRFAEFIGSLARGTIGSLIYAAKLASITSDTGAVLERVARVAVEETIGHVNMYVYNGLGSTSADLIAAVVNLIEGYTDPATGLPVAGYRPVGMRVDVAAMVEIPVPVSVLVQAAPLFRTDDTKAQVVTALTTVIRATISGGALRPIDMVNAVLGVTRVTGAEVVSPTLSTACPVNSVLVPGTFTVGWL